MAKPARVGKHGYPIASSPRRFSTHPFRFPPVQGDDGFPRCRKHHWQCLCTPRRTHARRFAPIVVSCPSACLSGIGGRKMRWALWAYYKLIFLKLRIKLVGWPRDIPFQNLSRITGLTQISRVAALWESGRMHFAPVTDAEYRAALDDPYICAPGPLHFGFAPNLGRCDIKKRKYRPKTDPLNLRRGRYVRNGPKSARWVSQRAEMRAEGRELSTDPIMSFSDDEGPVRRVQRRGGELEDDPIEEW